MPRARIAEIGLLAVALAAQALLFFRPLHSAVNYDEAVYLAALDALRHGQVLGSQVFAAQFPGFYDLLRGLSYVFGLSVAGIRTGLLCVYFLGTFGGWLVGRRFGGALGGLLVAAFLTIAPPLDLFGYQVIADTPTLALTLLALGVATLPGTVAAVVAGALFAGALSIKLTAVTAVPVLIWLLTRRELRHVAATAGFLVAAAVLLAVHARALGDLWADGVSYHADARGTPEVIPHPYRQIFDQIPHRTPFLALSIAAAVVALALFVRRRPLGVWPLWAWVVLSIAFLLVHSPLHYNHLVLFPFSLAVAAAATLGAALQRLSPRAMALGAAVLALLVVAGYAQQWRRVTLARVPEPASNTAAARALARLTPPTALIVDDRPIISFLAGRRVIGSLVDTAQLRFETGSLDDMQVIAQMQPASAIVLSRVLSRRPAVVRYVSAHYRLGYDRDGVRIYTRR